MLDRWAKKLDLRVIARRSDRRLRRAVEAEAVAASTRMEGAPVTADDALRLRSDTIERADWHPAVVAAWLHVSLAAIHPFRDGNGRTARVLASLAMYRGGFKDPAFTSLEEWWGRNTSTYYDASACLGTQFSPTADVV